MLKWAVIGMAVAVVVTLAVVVLSRSGGESFPTAFARYPSRMEYLPQDDPATWELLEKHLPRVFLSPDSYRPMDFYNEYLPNTHAYNESGKLIATEVTRELLRQLQDSESSSLRFLGDPASMLPPAPEAMSLTPTIYGRIYKDSVPGSEQELLFLKYSLVFPLSGLPAQIATWKRLAARLVGDPLDWHQLDIHGSIYVVLDAESHEPLAVMLSQHHNGRVFWPDDVPSWPGEDGVQVGYAAFSNEPHLISSDGRQRWAPAAGDPSQIEFIFGLTDKVPLTSGYDLVPGPHDGAVEIDPKLELLPHDDPLYTARMHLGERRTLWGFIPLFFKVGPPGIDYFTYPELRNLSDFMAFWNIDPTDSELLSLYSEHHKSMSELDAGPILEVQHQRLRAMLEDGVVR
ncbi:MAG: hypothetical protein EA428_14810 [Spirochaetaceae bacterium]|nr:MAG: hypothetical protein EA428_14810 [Spirochaetaceae bacterium]